MMCSRCGDLVIEDRLMDWSARWRCLKCGQVQDPMNVENHLATQRKNLYDPPDVTALSLSDATEQHLLKPKRK